MLQLQAVEEAVEVGAAKVGDGLEAGEEGATRETLEVSLGNVQHGRAEVELVEELCDKDV